MRKKREQPNKPGSPLWMTTFSDMVTLLLAFFVLLYGLSSLDAEKFAGFRASIQSSFGILDGGDVITIDPGINNSQIALEQLIQLESQLTDFVELEGLEGVVHIEHQERGLVVRFADQVFFDLGRADLKPESLVILTKLAPILIDLPNPIRIEGHTDNLPIRNAQFPSNWELSSYRATSVIRFLVEELGFSPDQLSAAGYGEYRPAVSNDTPENRALNRRVDIVVMRMDLWVEEPTAEME